MSDIYHSLNAELKTTFQEFEKYNNAEVTGVYIYERPLTEINVIASFCALNLRIKF